MPRQGSRVHRAAAKRQPSTGFDFTSHMQRLCADVARRLPELAHIDVQRIGFAFAQTRKAVMHGMQASLTPLRFENGSRYGIQDGRRVAVQRVFDSQGRELLYILTFYLPRFMNLDFEEKLVTVFHELWHVNPEFNGDLRRHAGRCYLHTRSEAVYDAQMAKLARRWLALFPPAGLYDFLRVDFAGLQRRHGRVFGTRIPCPRLLPVHVDSTR